MAGPYASLTSPYAPNHMDSALRIADLIAQRGRSAALAQHARRSMVGDLISGGARAVGGIFGARDEAKKTAAENAQIAEMIASGQPLDLSKLVAAVGVPRAKEIYTFVEAALAKQKASSLEANQTGLRQRAAGALKQGVDPSVINAELYGEGAPLLPSQLGPDPKAVEAAAAKKKLDEENTLIAEISEAMKHGMSRADAQQYYAAKTGGKLLGKEFFPEEPAKVERKLITVPGPGGVPMQRYATEEELEKGVRIYRAPTDTGGSGLPKLTGAQQDDLATMDTVVDLAGLATALGDKIGWKGVGGLWTGTIAGQAAKQLGWGTADEENLRNYLGNIQGTIAKLRGGTAFSAAEKAMLNSYTPTLNDSDTVIQSKLKSLGEFIALKRTNTLKYAGRETPAPPTGGGVPDGVKRALANEPANPPPQTPYVLADGSKWRKNTDGSITRVP